MQIKEMAERLQITARAIRFYEEKGLISPKKAEHSGYRLFSEEDVWRLQTIITLREVGMPIEDIRELLNRIDKEEESLLHYLEIQRSCMYDRWIELSRVIQTTEQMIGRIKQQKGIDPAALFELAEGNKRLRQMRNNWVDRWNFNQIADYYDISVNENKQGFYPYEDYELVLQEVVHATAPCPDEVGLDAGTGTGNLAKLFREKGVQMSAFDQAPQMLKQCQKKNPGMETKLGTFFAFPYFGGMFDFVVTSFALHHLTDDQKTLALAECKRVLKPGGRLVIADSMFADEEHRAWHIRALLQAGRKEAVAEIEDEYYADRSKLVQNLQELGFRVQARQLTTYVHLIEAKLM
ncbi:MerR family transcriptional regulator [Brevibacillus borstelensis]|uniref:MerR family transcriptional regulator n=1 Tax=Brevibacillus borstelensis TaxID=45462 RepID=UPI0004684B2C|nr:MerR family transcriptional regulator [Brevibacillus borstelensis]MCC0562541.1 MerR family transcriptional regulator [Brevibacillus borstelensis]MCM3469851.1 MerR family transcriptional regulator [Brevibacillus borstelensis]MCM3561522.1 MerR family transcriptional regulator [Brevibacillus borstelensis]MCM3589578.1 MerR family transcriptional regulator [Brevibacillus borstelensis]MCM3620662.1 MerR family transcriptional regulator [Brevibacillus borstelensis]